MEKGIFQKYKALRNTLNNHVTDVLLNLKNGQKLTITLYDIHFFLAQEKKFKLKDKDTMMGNKLTLKRGGTLINEIKKKWNSQV